MTDELRNPLAPGDVVVLGPIYLKAGDVVDVSSVEVRVTENGDLSDKYTESEATEYRYWNPDEDLWYDLERDKKGFYYEEGTGSRG